MKNLVFVVLLYYHNNQRRKNMITANLLSVGTWLDTAFHGIDYAVFSFFGKLHAAWLTPFVQIFTELGDSHFVVPMMVLGLVLCFFKKTRKYGMALFLAILIGTLITNGIAKPLVARHRPYVSLAGDSAFMGWYTEAGSLTESDRSFPSGHTTAAFEMAIAMFLMFKNKKFKWVFPVIAFFVGCSRLYLMVHYFTDVAGGFICGVIAGILAYFITKAIVNMLEKSNNKFFKWINDFDLGALFKRKKA